MMLSKPQYSVPSKYNLQRALMPTVLITKQDFRYFFLVIWYIRRMFHVTKQALGDDGAFVKLVQLDSDDFAVIVRGPSDVRLHNRYIGPDLSKAEEVFNAETGRFTVSRESSVG